ncbi:MAG: DUF1801 domain-containing protein [Actinomycetes bacterium]
MATSTDEREDYIAGAGARADDLRRLDAFIREHAPDLPPTMTASLTAPMLGYGEQAYRTRSMKEPTSWPVLALAAQKRYFSLYVCALEDGEYVAERHAAELGSVRCGKSCIRFSSVDKLNLNALGRILGDLNRRFVAGETLYGT